MQLKKKEVCQLILIGLFASFIASGCASFAGRELPIYTNEQISVPETKLSASYDVKAYGIYGESDLLASNFDKKVQKVLSASPLFSELRSGKTGTVPADYHYSFVLRNEGMPPAPIAFLNGFISGYTLGVIPAFARDIFIVTVDVKQKDKILKTYTYQDHMDTWIQLFLVVLTPFHAAPNVANATLDNMIMNFAHDLSDDMRTGVYLAQQPKLTPVAQPLEPGKNKTSQELPVSRI